MNFTVNTYYISSYFFDTLGNLISSKIGSEKNDKLLIKNSTPCRRNCMCYALNKFIAISRSDYHHDKLLVSSDGMNWSLQNLPDNVIFDNVLWIDELKLFFTIARNKVSGTNCSIYQSSNGTSWTKKCAVSTIASSANPPHGSAEIAYSPTKKVFLFIGENAYDSVTSHFYVFLTKDFINWEKIVMPTGFKASEYNYDKSCLIWSDTARAFLLSTESGIYKIIP